MLPKTTDLAQASQDHSGQYINMLTVLACQAPACHLIKAEQFGHEERLVL